VANLVDANNKVVIDSPETIKALEYAKEMYATFPPGTLSWLDPNNNKAFLDGQVSVTNNGISIYYATKTSTDEKVRALKEDVHHAAYPVGPVGTPTESHLFFNQMVMKYTKFPNAAKEFLRFMMEKEQFDPWLTAAGGYIAPPLDFYTKSAVWTCACVGSYSRFGADVFPAFVVYTNFNTGSSSEFLHVGHVGVNVALHKSAPAQDAQLGTFFRLEA